MPDLSRAALVAALAAAATAALPAAAQAAAPLVGTPSASDDYVVQLKLPALASYRGGAAGIPATSPKATGARKLDASSAAARSYRGLLTSTQDRVIARAGSPRVLYRYETAFAGFAARLDGAALRAVRSSPDVARVFRNGLRTKQQAVDTADPASVDALLGGRTGDGASYLGLPEGLWDRLGGPERAGDGVVVGVVDTGITPEHPSFSDTPEDTPQTPGTTPTYVGAPFGASRPAGWTGECAPGPADPTFTCNDKLIGARYFNESFKEASPLEPGSFDSPRDDDGHGSHTAATAAGDFGVKPYINGANGAQNDLGIAGGISGLAPRARVAAYKALWEGTKTTGGFDADLVAAIDAAVDDGVDVINYSIGGAGAAVLTSDSFAFLGASDAGVFVAQSAGNDGPDASTLGAQAGAPWTTTVAASTLQRSFRATATLTGGRSALSIAGESITPALPASPVIDASQGVVAGTPAAQAELCAPNALDPAKVGGKVVICERGGTVAGTALSRIGKSKEVRRAGGVGMVLYNPVDAQDTETDTHYVPTVHVSRTDGDRLKAALQDGAQLAITQGAATGLERGAVLAAFSSRGPQPDGGVPDIAKPDVTAPGVNIIAAASPAPVASTDLQAGQWFQAISGTSMSSPHVAGAGALLAQAHPDWDPSEIKSALMTSASSDVVREDGTTRATAFDTGSGEIAPTAAADPGLLVRAGTGDYVSYLAGQGIDVSAGDPAPELAAQDLNVPSISSARVAGELETTRTFTGATQGRSSWRVTVEAPAGFTGTTDTPTFSVGRGESVPVAFTFTRTDAPLGAYAYGAVTLTDGTRTVRLPVSLKPVVAKAPARTTIETEAASGSEPLAVQAGATPLGVTAWGLAKSVEEPGLTVRTGDLSDTADDANVVRELTVPAGAQLLGARLEVVDGGDAGTDLDLYVIKDGEVVAQSAAGGSDEAVSLPLPEAGTYTVVVNGYATKDPSTFTLRHWVVTDPTPNDPGDGPAIDVAGSPFAPELGADPGASLSYRGVDEPGTYFGVVTYAPGASTAPEDIGALTVVELTKVGSAVDSIPTQPTYTPQNGPTTPAGPTPTTTTAATTTTTAPTTPVAPPTPPAAPAAPATPAAPAAPASAAGTALRLDARSLRLSGRRATLRLTLSRRARVSVVVRRGGRVLTRGRAVSAAAGTRSVRLTLGRRLARGSYRVTVTAQVGSRTSRDVLSVRVR